MKQKFHIWKNVKEKELLIQEFAVLTANIRKQKLPVLQDEDFSLLCEQTYSSEEVNKATSRGKDELILLLRNQHFFPIGQYMDKIADAVIAMYTDKGEQREDLIFDDKEALMASIEESGKVTEIEDEAENNLVDKNDNNIGKLSEDNSNNNETTSNSTKNNSAQLDEETN